MQGGGGGTIFHNSGPKFNFMEIACRLCTLHSECKTLEGNGASCSTDLLEEYLVYS